MSAIIGFRSIQNQQLLSKVGEISLFAAVGYLATKIITSINPLFGALYIGSVVAIRKIFYHLFQNSPNYHWFGPLVMLGIIPLAAYVTKIVILKAVLLDIITAAAFKAILYLQRHISHA